MKVYVLYIQLKMDAFFAWQKTVRIFYVVFIDMDITESQRYGF